MAVVFGVGEWSIIFVNEILKAGVTVRLNDFNFNMTPAKGLAHNLTKIHKSELQVLYAGTMLALWLDKMHEDGRPVLSLTLDSCGNLVGVQYGDCTILENGKFSTVQWEQIFGVESPVVVANKVMETSGD